MRPTEPVEENDILRKIDKSLEQAVLELGLEWQEFQIKRQKYSYLAVDHFTGENNHPLTYSWFKWGASFVASPASGDGMGSRHTMPSPNARDSRIYSAGLEELIAFFKQGIDSVPLDEYWQKHHLDFLIPFYEAHAPEEYRQAYLANIQLRQILQETTDALGEGKYPIDKGVYEEIGQAAANLQIGVMANNELAQVVDPVTEVTDLLEDVFMILVERDTNNVQTEELTALIEVKSTYTEEIWPLIANVISQQTAVGPNKERVIRCAESNYDAAQNQYPTAIEDAYKACADAGLLPETATYPTYEDRTESVVEDLTTVVDGRNE